MKSTSLNQWFTFLGNVGVVAGILFLAIEIQQNTSMMRAQTRDAMTEKQMVFYALVVEDPDVAEIYINARNDQFEYESEDPAFARFVFLWLSQLRMWENELYQYRQGLFEAEEFESRQLLWSRNVSRQIYREIWDGQKYSFSPDFVELLDSLIVESASN